VKVGDLVRCGSEFAIIIDTRWTTDYPQEQWVTTIWTDGTVEQLLVTEHHLELVNESR